MKLIFIKASWSKESLRVEKIIDKIVKNFSNIKLITYDVDTHLEDLKYFTIGDVLPVIILLDTASNEITRIVGQCSYEDLENNIIKNM